MIIKNKKDLHGVISDITKIIQSNMDAGYGPQDISKAIVNYLEEKSNENFNKKVDAADAARFQKYADELVRLMEAANDK